MPFVGYWRACRGVIADDEAFIGSELTTLALAASALRLQLSAVQSQLLSLEHAMVAVGSKTPEVPTSYNTSTVAVDASADALASPAVAAYEATGLASAGAATPAVDGHASDAAKDLQSAETGIRLRQSASAARHAIAVDAVGERLLDHAFNPAAVKVCAGS